MAHIPVKLAGAGSQTSTAAVAVPFPPDPLAVRVNAVVPETWVETFPAAGGVTCPIPGAMLTVLAPDTDQLADSPHPRSSTREELR